MIPDFLFNCVPTVGPIITAASNRIANEPNGKMNRFLRYHRRLQNRVKRCRIKNTPFDDNKMKLTLVLHKGMRLDVKKYSN